MILSDEQRNWLQRRALQSAPHEACGFILDDGEIIEIANIHAQPYRGFSMSGYDITNKLDTHDLSRIVAIWHTHPKGTIKPSKTDMEAIRRGAILDSWAYFIATKDEVTQWNTADYAPKDESFWESFAI